MRTVKIKQKYYKDLPFMYEDLGLIKDNECDPSKVLFSKEDLKLLEKTTRMLFKKEYPYSSPKQIEASVQMHLLNLGPSDRASGAIKPGYVLILDK